MSRYVVYMEHAEEGGYVVWCPALPGCVSQGETVGEALEMVKDAIQGYLESLKSTESRYLQALSKRCPRWRS